MQRISHLFTFNWKVQKQTCVTSVKTKQVCRLVSLTFQFWNIILCTLVTPCSNTFCSQHQEKKFVSFNTMSFRALRKLSCLCIFPMHLQAVWLNIPQANYLSQNTHNCISHLAALLRMLKCNFIRFIKQLGDEFDICGIVHHHSINKNNQRDAACSIRLYYALWQHSTCFGCSLHPSSGVYMNCTCITS